jgi:hypothetical protein
MIWLYASCVPIAIPPVDRRKPAQLRAFAAAIVDASSLTVRANAQLSEKR